MDVYLFCTDGLCGMMQAIEAVFPNSRLQRYIVHQIRASTRYVSYKDIKQVIADLKKIYTAVTLDEAENNLLAFAERWRKQYPSCVKSWEENWEVLTTFFEYPIEIRKIIYTTNIIEGLNRQFRQITKNKPSFTNDDSLRRMLYLASQRIMKHWHTHSRNCGRQGKVRQIPPCFHSAILDFVEYRLHKIFCHARFYTPEMFWGMGGYIVCLPLEDD